MWSYNPWSYASWSAEGDTVRNFPVTVSDTAHAALTMTSLVTAILSSVVSANTSTISTANQKNLLTDIGHVVTQMIVTWSNSITDTANATSPVVFTANAISQIVDTILASGVCASVIAAKNGIVETAFVHDNLTRDWPVSPSDAVNAADTMQSNLVTMVLVLDQALAQASISFSANLTMLVNDSVVANETWSQHIGAHELLSDGVNAVLTFRLDGDVYTGVVINTETTGITEYTNFPFNSFCSFGGKYYGCAADGIYRLEGADDNGTDIESSIRTGLLRMADGIKTRNPEAWFGYTATGDLVLKVVTTNPDGEKEQNWYKLEKRVADAPRSTRVKIGKGLSSVYWSFELVGAKGAQFALDNIKLFPVKLERRI